MSNIAKMDIKQEKYMLITCLNKLYNQCALLLLAVLSQLCSIYLHIFVVCETAHRIHIPKTAFFPNSQSNVI